MIKYIYYCISYPNFNGAKSESEDRGNNEGDEFIGSQPTSGRWSLDGKKFILSGTRMN
jgi:hypothetical protein